MSSLGNILISAGDQLTIDASRGAFNYRFPTSYVSRGGKIALTDLALYYSWNNVTAAFSNTTGCSYTWTDGITYPVVFPEGFYSIADLNGFFSFQQRKNGHYLLDGNGVEVYYLSFETNAVYYAVTVTSRALPTTLPAGWTNPASVVLNGLAPQLLIGATNWGKLLGFATGSYPAVQGSLTLQFNSTLVPEISPVTSVLVLCDWVNDTRFNYRPSVIASFTPSSTFGSIINYRPITLLKYDITPSNYQGIQVRFVDQEYRPLRMLDTKQTLISLIVES